MNTPNTEIKPEPKWRLLSADEPKREGDRWYRAQWSDALWTPYDPTLEKPTGHLLCFRQMTPAEEHAEELLEYVTTSARTFDGRIHQCRECGHPWHAPHALDCLAGHLLTITAAIAKAEGRSTTHG